MNDKAGNSGIKETADKSILETIAEKTRERISEKKRRIPLGELKARAAGMPKHKTGEAYPFERALARPGMSFICEVKKASPSKGVIAKDFPYVEIAREYQAAGADALSVLTEPYFFQGADAYLTKIRDAVTLPLLRKDFTVEEYMLYEAKVIGADAVLLICAILSENQLREYSEIAGELGLSVLVEAHDQQEVRMAINAGARIIGVNNRNLKDFTVDIQNSVGLRKQIPGDILFVSESGMKTREDIAALEENGTDAVLIGEVLMRSCDKKRKLEELRHPLCSVGGAEGEEK